MATFNQFKGIKRILASNTAYTATTNNDYLYFVRQSTTSTEGDIWFQGTHYGHFGEHDLDAINTALAGFLTGQSETGYKNVKEYIDEAVSAITSGMTTSVEKDPNAFSGLTIEDRSTTPNVKDYVVNLQNVAQADELAAVENSLGFNGTAYTNSGQYISGDTVAADIDRLDTAIVGVQSDFNREVDAIEEAVGLNTDGSYVDKSGTNYLDNATSVEGEIAALDEALKAVADRTVVESGSTENYVNLTVATDNTGKTTIAIDDSALKSAIEAMDLTEVHETGKAIVAVSEADGVVSATAGTIAAQYVDVADAAGKFTGSTVEEVLAEIDTAYKAADAAIIGDATESGNTLGKLEDRIDALDADAKEYHIVKTTTGLPETIKERYSLVDADGHVSGDTVDIPKDSHIVSITYITTSGDPHYQNLEYVYVDASGNNQTVYVDMSQLVLETEFASGVSATGGVVHGVVDPASEAFLTVGADGFKLSGVQDAIDDAKTAATAYTQSEIQKLDVTGDTAVAGQYVAAIEETDGVVAVKTRANVSEAVLNNYEKGSDASAVAATDTVNEAISKLENQVDAAKAAATTEVLEGTDAGNNLSIASGTAADGHVQYTINLSDVASATALTETASTLYNMVTAETHTRESEDNRLEALITGVTEGLAEEIAARKAVDGQNGQTYAANSGTNYISSATSLNDADVKLDTALKGVDDRLDAVEDTYITGVTVNDCAATVTDHVAAVEIHADDIEIGTALTADTGSSVSGFGADAKIDDVLQAIMDELNEATAGSYSGVTSTGHSLSVTNQVNGNNVEINKQSASLAKAQDGHIFLEQDAQDSDKVYAAMYWIDEEN